MGTYMLYTPTVSYRTLTSLKEVIMTLSAKVIDYDEFKIEVRHGFVMEDLLQEINCSTFNPKKKIYTEIVGESGRDTGGLTREMFCYFGRDLKRSCAGSGNIKIPRHDTVKLQVNSQLNFKYCS